MQRAMQLLEHLTQCDGAPGFEDEVRTFFENELAPVGELSRDGVGSVLCTKKGSSERPRVALDCHLDEVGFIIQHITPRGFLKFLPLGGWWNHILPAQRLTVHAGADRIEGVIGSTPPHFLPADKRSQVLEIQEMYIDIGAGSREDAEKWGVRVGSWAVPRSSFTTLRDPRYLLSKAFDNRAGCALCIETMQRITDHPNTVIGVGSVQEEVGLRGATTSSVLAEPDVAIVLECSPADDTPGFQPEEQQGALGGGAQIRAYDPSMIANPKLVEFAIETARVESIPHQVTVRASGGTDAGRIHLSRRGVPTVVVAVPARFIHAHTSVLNIEDYLAARQLVASLVARLDAARLAELKQ